MTKQYESSGPKVGNKASSTNKAKTESRIERLEAMLHKHESELSFLKREVNRLKSDLSQTVNFVRKRD